MAPDTQISKASYCSILEAILGLLCKLEPDNTDLPPVNKSKLIQ